MNRGRIPGAGAGEEPPGSGSPSRVRDLFLEALELEPGRREAFLTAACDGDQALRARVAALLVAHERLEAGGETSAPGVPTGPLDPFRAVALLEASAPPLRPGDTLGRFRVIGTLGEGGMGVVYRAHDPRLDRPVALKLLPPLSASDSRAGDRLMDEARAASALDHPHVGTVFEVGEEGGLRYIAMALYDGGTLRRRLGERGPLPLPDALRVAREVAEGLAAAHSRGIVHRDVKPENVVFDGEGRAKLLDFGLAVGGIARRSDPVSGGTAGYASPESGEAAADPRTDVWSAGVLLHEMLSGVRPPVRDGRPVPVLPRSVPDAVVRIVERCLEPDPGARFSSAGELAEALRSAGGGRPVRRRLVAAGVVTVAAVGLLVGFVAARELPRVTTAQGWATGVLEDRPWVVVADFETGPGGDPGLALAAREALSVDLQQSGTVSVLGRGQVAAVLRRMGVEPDAPVDLPVALEVAQRTGAGAVVAATVGRAGSRHVLAGRVVDPGTGVELFAVRTAAGEERALGAVERLSREIRRRLGEDPRTLRESRPLPEVTTPSLEALRLYAEAERELVRDGRRAAALLASAVELDSTFAMAHRMSAALAYTALRFGEGALHLDRAYRFRDRLPEPERLHVEALRDIQVTYRPERAAATYEVLLDRYPRDPAAWNNLGVIRQGWLDDHPGALEAFLRGAEVDPGYGLALTNATIQAAILGEWSRADSLAQVAADGGVEAFALRWRGRRAFALGHHDEARRECDAILEQSLAAPIGSDDLEVCGSMDVASGRLDAGVRRLEASAEVAFREARYRNAAHAAHGLSLAALYRGDREGAAAALAAVPERIPAMAFQEPDRFLTRTSLRVHATLLGDRALAERVAAEYPPHSDPDHWLSQDGEDLVAAAGALERGDPGGALSALARREATGLRPVGWRVWEELIRGWALEQAGDLDGALEAFARAADPGFHVVGVFTKDRLLLPVALDALARVAGKRGDPAGEEGARRRLVELWAGADSGPPPADPFGRARRP